MKTEKRLGIWMDHASAHLIPFPSDSETVIQIVESNKSHDGGEAGNRGDTHFHNAEQGQESAYYKHLSNIIKDFSDVILFGPTDAKAELHNILKEDRQFENINIEVESSDKMTENELRAFVKKHFSPN